MSDFTIKIHPRCARCANSCVFGPESPVPNECAVFSPHSYPAPKDAAPDPTPTRRPVSHYMTGTMECIDWIRAALTPEEYRGHLKGCALKYLYRYKNKGGADDLHKAETYSRWLREEVEKEGGAK